MTMLVMVLSAALMARPQAKTIMPLKKVPISTLNFEQGLMNNETAAIITDTFGFTWVSTATGLQRYNGYYLENIDPVAGADTIRIRSRGYFFKLASGDIWISCTKGILDYNPFTNRFKMIIPFPVPADEAYGIIATSETGEGVWCLQKGAGMVIYNKNNGRLKEKIPSLSTGTIDDFIRSDLIKSKTIISACPNHIFIRTAPHALLDFNTADKTFEAVNIPGEITGVGCNSSFFYISTPAELLKYNITGRRLVNRYALRNITGQVVEACGIYAIGDNRIIASVNELLVEFDADFKIPRLLTTFNGQPLLLAGRIEHIYHDAFDRIWLLTNDDIKRIQDKEVPFDYLVYPFAANNFVRSLYYDEEAKQLLAGCINGGIQLYDSSSRPVWRSGVQTNEVKDILSITKLSAGRFLVITWGKGWYELNAATGKLTAFDVSAAKNWQQQLFANGFSANTQRLNDSTLIVASFSNIFTCIFRQNRLVSVKPSFPSFSIVTDRINGCFSASDGALWAGFYQGLLYRLDKDSNLAVIRLPEKFSIRCFAEDAAHHIWIGTSSGLYVCDLKGHLLKSFYKKSGLLNDCMYSLLPLAGQSAVIGGSNMGLSVISLTGDITNYTRELGLQENEFNTSSALITASGKYYFGGVNGITAFYPASLREAQGRPVLNLIRLLVNDSSYNLPAKFQDGTIKLNYDQNHLQFDFAAMGPLNANKYFYRYRLTGFEKSWQRTLQPTNIRYVLQPGMYTLEVICTSGLSGSEAGKNILIFIAPPFWVRWWFFLITSICAVAVVALLVLFYSKRKYQLALQELRVEQRLQSQRERISRDLHDNLGAQATAIYHGTEVLKQHTGYKKDNLVENLHDTAADILYTLRETMWVMKSGKTDAAALWVRVLNYTRKISANFPAAIITTGNAPPGILLEASVALNVILITQEALNNAVRHSGSLCVNLSSSFTPHTWSIEITDNGRGFDPASDNKRADSYGLENMAGRARESNLVFSVLSETGKGTKVVLEINLS
jgi:signal transduction histidine kinase